MLGSGGAGSTFDQGGTWGVADGKAFNSPTFGAEMLTDPGLEGTYLSGRNTSLVDGGGSPSCAQSSDVHSGSKAQAVRATASVDFMSATVATQPTAGNWYAYSIWAKRLSGTGGTASLNVAMSVLGDKYDYYTDASYTQINHTVRAMGTALAFRPFRDNGASNFDSVEVDDMSFKPLLASTLYATVDTHTADVLASADLVVTAGTQVGLVVSYQDTLNLVLAYIDGTNCKLDKCVAGTWTSVISAAATYSSGATIRCIKDGTSYSLFYNNAKVGSTSTISDVALISNTKHGIFSTYSGNTLDNFTVYARGTNGEYNTLGTWSQP
jgi:hypothetical protein